MRPGQAPPVSRPLNTPVMTPSPAKPSSGPWAQCRAAMSRMTAKEAAKELGVSRKTYYEWEQRGLQGMMEALQDKKSGRPAKERDPETEELRQEKARLEMQLFLAEQTQEMREILESYPGLQELVEKSEETEEKKSGRKRSD